MPNPAIPDFTELGARKLAELQANGYRITGYCFERQVEGTQPQRGFIDSWGFVGWWRPGMQPSKPLTDEFVNKVVRSKQPHLDTDTPAWARNFDECKYWLEAAHGVADMKGDPAC